MPTPSAKKPTYTDNHTLLLQLGGQMEGLAAALKEFVVQQGEENRRIHERIDATGERAAVAVGAVKDSLAARGQVSGNFVLLIVTTILSFIAIVGGAVTAYVGGRIEALKPTLHFQEEIMRLTATNLREQERDHADLRVKVAELDGAQGQRRAE